MACFRSLVNTGEGFLFVGFPFNSLVALLRELGLILYCDGFWSTGSESASAYTYALPFAHLLSPIRFHSFL